jgi:glucosylglycerate phosphorylase
MENSEPKDYSESFEGEKPNRSMRIPHHAQPDYSRPLLEIPGKAREKMMGRLRFLYGEAAAEKYMPELERILRVHYAHKPQEMIDQDKGFNPQDRFTQRDMILITYGDLLRGEGHSPLDCLDKFVQYSGLRDTFNTLHILPFFPYSSDKGFSVTDFQSVDPNLGSWQDIEDMGKRYQLMFDGVLNHISAKSPAFQEFLNGSPYFKDIAIAYKSRDALTPEQQKSSSVLEPLIS